MAIAITVEPESGGVPASAFRLLINGVVVATGLTVSQTHFAVSEVLLRIAFPDTADSRGRPSPKANTGAPRPRLPRAATLRLASIAA
jgi:hypothetical protein